ncbi:unnamed protein product [Clonostachys rosea]|uniref:F-box domain-containing protein n=1 Tax=Bionectria ochroleuca TaxID=29856 RepID=A0ABY6UMV1_BIOOC|nr:unnamed protein product [Clonostachys rosea]
MEVLEVNTSHEAMEKVFSAVELLEIILLYLDHKDLLLSQLINTHFKNVVSQSLAIQQKLFFTPGAASDMPQQNPLLKALFPTFFSLNRPVSTDFFYNIVCDSMDWYDRNERCESVLRPDASWRRMFPVQPAAKLEQIRIYTHDYCLYRTGKPVLARLGDEVEILQEHGLRMDLLYDLVVHLWGLHPSTQMYIHWEMFPLFGGVEEWQDGCQRDDAWSARDLTAFPLFLQEDMADGDEKTINRITLYYQHDSACGGPPWEPDLKIDSSFNSMIEADRTKLLRFIGRVALGWNRWDEYVDDEDPVDEDGTDDDDD